MFCLGQQSIIDLLDHKQLPLERLNERQIFEKHGFRKEPSEK
jgi:hypothetical protein